MADAILHGGNLREAARRYAIALDDWLDLSTGINPRGYPVPPVPPDAWRRLPEDDDGLADCAARYYGAPHALPVAGSQAAIRALPQILTRGVAGVAPLAYGEYAPAFARAGHSIDTFDITCADLPATLDHVIIGNPNNPTADRLSRETLMRWHAQLASRGGTLIVDEAFADVDPDASLAAETARDGLVVLRSVGKFFGLAGIRAGFVLAAPAMTGALRDALGAWTVGGPARHATIAAFADHAWQHETRDRLKRDGARLAALIARHGFDVRATPLFTWTPTPRAPSLQHELAMRGIWTRLFDRPGMTTSLRIGLAGSEGDWARLERALAEIRA
ncbi:MULTISPECIES: threonine-phosphate decarboxylase CobD [unclassified Caballeronia]|uniref:threonine-phosphate decarboxylase CobD n=1 Tax=unclassified Caballeronia TaxID=2646786 RepID=UPI0028652A95|nr:MULTISPECIES: threonine-phosphate decarboxylase CobD [unclassified Caballeronia]MDR5736428.1 threonine-phosphate decarboxylase CobD [Caballeronia sp. LZ016]MDR5811095.1 threonine-phosphate decarboxylase CobD [Caballeronia sp. LZ019]